MREDRWILPVGIFGRSGVRLLILKFSTVMMNCGLEQILLLTPAPLPELHPGEGKCYVWFVFSWFGFQIWTGQPRMVDRLGVRGLARMGDDGALKRTLCRMGGWLNQGEGVMYPIWTGQQKRMSRERVHYKKGGNFCLLTRDDSVFIMSFDRLADIKG